jgi:uncharacterized DUF497 family protein
MSSHAPDGKAPPASSAQYRAHPEDRYLTAGFLRGKMVVLVWTPRNENWRIISMRYCHADEQALWRKKIGV